MEPNEKSQIVYRPTAIPNNQNMQLVILFFLVIVTLKGAVLTEHSELQGKYILELNNMNGRAHWTQKNGAHAIWYCTESRWGRWMIGSKDDLGENSCFIASPDDEVKPQQATTWKYVDSNDGQWKSASNNIIVAEILNGKTSIETSIIHIYNDKRIVI